MTLDFLGQGTSSANYRPEFLDYFDQKDKETDDDSNAQIPSNNKPPENTVPEADSPAGQALQKQLQQIAGGQPVLQNVAAANAASNNPSKFQQCIAEGDLEFVSSIFIIINIKYFIYILYIHTSKKQ